MAIASWRYLVVEMTLHLARTEPEEAMRLAVRVNLRPANHVNNSSSNVETRSTWCVEEYQVVPRI